MGNSVVRENNNEGSKGEAPISKVQRVEGNKDFRIFLKFVNGQSFSSVNPIRLAKALKDVLGEIKNAQIMADGKLLIVCSSEAQRKKAASLKMICEKQIESIAPMSKGGLKGVVYGVSLEMTMEDLLRGVEKAKASNRHGSINNIVITRPVEGSNALAVPSLPEINHNNNSSFCLRPYQLDNARSRLISEAKPARAWLVPGWETAWEYQVLFVSCYSCSMAQTMGAAGVSTSSLQNQPHSSGGKTLQHGENDVSANNLGDGPVPDNGSSKKVLAGPSAASGRDWSKEAPVVEGRH
ncbi:hypothetical protein WMY93_009951 [Mugilogobius chulae]|uniref:Uncharacterized protein n=1 Tax=Mugilogobius chulae TaxID=88201 RepID=A0AAW0P5P2_9GOBI